MADGPCRTLEENNSGDEKMKSLKGTQTEQNLLAAFAGESQARNRYTYFASEAKKAGYEQISAIFLETAENEKEHAKVYFKHLQGGMVKTQRIVNNYVAVNFCFGSRSTFDHRNRF